MEGSGGEGGIDSRDVRENECPPTSTPPLGSDNMIMLTVPCEVQCTNIKQNKERDSQLVQL